MSPQIPSRMTDRSGIELPFPTDQSHSVYSPRNIILILIIIMYIYIKLKDVSSDRKYVRGNEKSPLG